MESPEQAIRHALEGMSHSIFNAHGISMYERDQVEKFIRRQVEQITKVHCDNLVEQAIAQLQALRSQMDNGQIDDFHTQSSDILYADMPAHLKLRARICLDIIIMDLIGYQRVMRAAAQMEKGDTDDTR